MSQTDAPTTEDLAAACRSALPELAAALSRGLGSEVAVEVQEKAAFDADNLPPEFNGPGLVLLLQGAETAAAIVLPETTGVLPEWYRSPDDAGATMLATLGRELAALLAPEGESFSHSAAGAVQSIARALSRAMTPNGASLLPLDLAAPEAAGQMSVLWPLGMPEALLDENEDRSRHAVGGPATRRRGGHDFSTLPGYCRSLLKIDVPVGVQLAAKRETVQEIIEIVPGAIIKFEKGCEELLQMIVGGQTIAEGEAVKIGDKFGFRVTSMLMPREHFIPVKRPRTD